MIRSEPFRRLPFEEIPDIPRREHALARAETRHVVVRSAHFGEHRVFLREAGEGPPLLLIHGLMTSSYSFRYVIEPLSRHYRVLVPDLPGAGRSDKPDVAYSAPALAEWILELVTALDVRGTRCIGNSLGGYLCMRAALRDGAVFSRLVNIHSPGVADARLRALHLALALPGPGRALAWYVRSRPERFAHANVHYFDESLKSREEAREYGQPLETEAGARAFVRYLAECLDPSELSSFGRDLERRRAVGEKFPVPLQLIYARRDPMVPPRVGRALSALVPSAELVWLEDTSHFAHVDSPERLLDVVLPFLAG